MVLAFIKMQPQAEALEIKTSLNPVEVRREIHDLIPSISEATSIVIGFTKNISLELSKINNMEVAIPKANAGFKELKQYGEQIANLEKKVTLSSKKIAKLLLPRTESDNRDPLKYLEDKASLVRLLVSEHGGNVRRTIKACHYLKEASEVHNASLKENAEVLSGTKLGRSWKWEAEVAVDAQIRATKGFLGLGILSNRARYLDLKDRRRQVVELGEQIISPPYAAELKIDGATKACVQLIIELAQDFIKCQDALLMQKSKALLEERAPTLRDLVPILKNEFLENLCNTTQTKLESVLGRDLSHSELDILTDVVPSVAENRGYTLSPSVFSDRLHEVLGSLQIHNRERMDINDALIWLSRIGCSNSIEVFDQECSKLRTSLKELAEVTESQYYASYVESRRRPELPPINQLLIKTICDSEAVQKAVGHDRQECRELIIKFAAKAMFGSTDGGHWHRILLANPEKLTALPALILSLYAHNVNEFQMELVIEHLQSAIDIHGVDEIIKFSSKSDGLKDFVKAYLNSPTECCNFASESGKALVAAGYKVIEDQLLISDNSFNTSKLLERLTLNDNPLSRGLLAKLESQSIPIESDGVGLLLNRTYIDAKGEEKWDFEAHRSGMNLALKICSTDENEVATQMIRPFCKHPNQLEEGDVRIIAEFSGKNPGDIIAAIKFCHSIGDFSPSSINEAIACTQIPGIEKIVAEISPHATLLVKNIEALKCISENFEVIKAACLETKEFRKYEPTAALLNPYEQAWIGSSRFHQLNRIYESRGEISTGFSDGLLAHVDKKLGNEFSSDMLSKQFNQEINILAAQMNIALDSVSNDNFRIQQHESKILSLVTGSRATATNIIEGIQFGAATFQNNLDFCLKDKDAKTLVSTDAPIEILSYGKKVLSDAKFLDYPPAFGAAVLCKVAESGLNGDDFVKLCKLITPQSAIATDKYAIEYIASYLKESPKQQALLLKCIANKTSSLSNAKQLLAVMAIINSLKHLDLAEKVSQVTEEKAVVDLAQLAKIVTTEASKLLADRYPAELMTNLKPEELSEFIEKFCTYETTLKQFHSAPKVPILRVLGIKELLDSSKILDPDSKLTLKYLDTLMMSPEEVKVAKDYIEAAANNKETKILFEGSTVDEIKQARILENFHDRTRIYSHVIAEVTPEDKVRDIHRQLTTFLDEHCSSCFKVVESITDNSRAKELALKGKALDTFIKSQNNLHDVRLLFPELEGIAGLEAVGTARGLFQDILEQQQQLRLFAEVRKLLSAKDSAVSCLKKFEEVRIALGTSPVSELIERLGFDVHNSFRTKVFLGEINALETALNSATLVETEEYAAKLLKRHLSEANKASNQTKEFLGHIVALSNRVAEVFSSELDKLAPLIQSLQDTPNEFSAAFQSKQPALYERISRYQERVKGDSLAALFSEYASTLSLKSDLVSLVSIAKSESEATTYHYRIEEKFSAQLEATKGQCLDYRSSINSIGNSVYLISLQDQIRTLLIAKDNYGKLRFDQIVYLAPIQTADEQFRPAIVADIPYTPDGTAMSWSKFEGALNFLVRLSKDMKIPLVIPQRSMLAYGQQLEDFCKDHQVSLINENIVLKILPGPSGSTYLELEGFHSYRVDTKITSNAWVLA